MYTLSPEDPSHIGPYLLIGRLGAGGMGRVYLARSKGGRTVAVKVVHDAFVHNPEFRRRFAQEVESARKVGGTWTAPVLDADIEGPVPWVATGYIPGPDLHAVVSGEHGPLPLASVLALANGLARALGDIHGAGLVHRDLKPSNVLLTVDGPRVIDFGIARALVTPVDGFLTRTGAVIGSPGFMSPEQVRGEPRVAPASDVFCLGTVLHYAATGRTPFGALDRGAHALMFRIAEEEADLTGLQPPLAELVRDCLDKDPRDRPATDEIAARTEPWSLAARPAWLPAELLARLGSRAGRLLDQDAPGRVVTSAAKLQPGAEAEAKGESEPGREPEAESLPSPEPTPDPKPKPAPQPSPDLESSFDPEPSLAPVLDSAPQDRTMPGEAALHPRRPNRLRRGLVLAAGLLVLTGAGVVLAPVLGEAGTAGDDDGTPLRRTSPTPSADNTSSFVGTWSGEVTDGTEEGGIQFVSFTIDKRATGTRNSADFVLQYPERVCVGQIPAMVVEGRHTVVTHQDLDATDMDQGPSCSPDTQTLTLKGEALEWRAGNIKALLRKDASAHPSEEVLQTYVGSWTTPDTNPALSLDIRHLKPGAEIEFSAGEGSRWCGVTAVVTVVARDRLFAAVKDPTQPDMGICHGHDTFDIRPAGKDRLRILTRRGAPYVFTRTGA
ncbi:protein kinase [Streptomyces sp. NPDC005989]|uniref:protein kinase domain-containing protein n=1 Tax=Streptomyces sp. NPDC005989 TaxID=3156727 RepID=UPI0034096226